MMRHVPRNVLPALAALALAAPSAAPARPSARPPQGTLVGALRHKGCPSAPVGAEVTVIGRDVSARTDGSGRFSLSLPPGGYSLVIGGPGLVPDQRVDDVVVPSGQTHDLGVIDVWPEERPAGCTAAAPAPAPEAIVATAPEAPAVDLPGASVAPQTASAEQLWLRGSGGAAPGQFGLQGNPARDDEDALGPPSFGVGPMGSLWVLDALNGRVQRFDAKGHLASGFAFGRRGEEPVVEADLAVSDDGHVWIFTDAESAAMLAQYEGGGRVLVSAVLPPSFRGVDLLFAGRGRPLFLMQNGQAVRAELAWGGIRAEGPLPGLPAGDLYARAERVDRWRAAVKLAAADGRVKRSVQLHSRVPIAGVRLVGVDRRGDIVVALDRVEPGDDVFAPRAEVLLLAVDARGHLSGAVAVPPGGRRFEFREFALHPDGGVVQMQSDATEVRFVRWTLKPPPRDAIAGEGLVRGRVVDGPRPGSGASVTIGRLKRSVAAAPDGSFELRLPAGNWVVSVRRAAAAPDAAPLEVRVAVAAGATVDLGALNVAARPPPPPPPGGVGAARPGAADGGGSGGSAHGGSANGGAR
jgi:hypothetical protein